MAENPEVKKLEQVVAQEDAQISSLMDQMRHRRIGLTAQSIVTQDIRVVAGGSLLARSVISNHARMVKTGG